MSLNTLPQPAREQLDTLEASFSPGLRQAGLSCADAAGRLQIQAAPPLKRGSMVPESWITNPIVRLFKSRKKTDSSAKPGRDDPEAAWQKAGKRRRLILLTGVLAQTAIATWYMRAVLP
ncbi:MAG: hypothetical protein M0Q54_11755, partial [Pigmentiphaga sp.]|nr:hypothetical protein [Pigmentiphaga sp.]